jgi:hypothetical protein
MDPQFPDSFDRGQLSIDWNSRQNDSFPITIDAASYVPQGMYLDPSVLNSSFDFLPNSSFLIPDPGIFPHPDIPDRPSEQRLQDQYLHNPGGAAIGNSHGQDLGNSAHPDFSRSLIDEMGPATLPPSDMNNAMSYHPPAMHLDAGTVDTFSWLRHRTVGEGQLPDQMSIFEGNNCSNLPPTLFAGGPLVELNQPSFDHGQPQPALDYPAWVNDVTQSKIPLAGVPQPSCFSVIRGSDYKTWWSEDQLAALNDRTEKHRVRRTSMRTTHNRSFILPVDSCFSHIEAAGTK